MWVWLFLLYLCRLIIIHLPLSIHIMDTLSSLYAVSQTSLRLSSCCYSVEESFVFFFILGGLFRVFLPVCHNLIASCFLFVWACELDSWIFLFPLAFLSCRCLSHGFSQWHTTYAVRGPLATSHAALLRLFVGSLRCAFTVFLAGHPFLHCLFDFDHLFHSVGFSLVYYADFIFLFFFSVFLVFHLYPLIVHPFSCSLLVSPGSSPSGVSFLHHFSLLLAAHALFRFPASFGGTVLSSCPLLLFLGGFSFPLW